MSHEIEVNYSILNGSIRGKRSFPLISKKSGKALRAVAEAKARLIVQKMIKCDPQQIIINHLSIG